MSRLILLSDGHLCIDKPIGRFDNDMLQVSLNKLNFIFEYAYTSGIHSILQAGDFVDLERSWGLLSALSKFLEEWKQKGIILYVVLGQHDSYYHNMSNQKTIMGVLISTGLVKRLSSIPENIEGSVFNAYGASYGEEIPNPCSTSRRNILVCHRQILMKKEWAMQDGFDYAPQFLKTYDKFDLILCGDAHQKFDFKLDGRYICNSGPLMRLEATDEMIKHMPGFYVFDAFKKNPLSFHLVPAKAGEEVLSKEHILLQKKRKQNFDDFIMKIQEIDQQDQSLDFSQNLKTIMKKSKTSDDVKYMIGEYIAKGE